MGRGVIVLTGTCEIVDPQAKSCLSAVFRRIHLSAHLSWMSVEDVARFFNQFLLRFVPSCPANDWKHWEHVFLDKEGPWAGHRPISVDMVKQFFMRQITQASCMDLGNFMPSDQPGSNEFRVHSERMNDFFTRLRHEIRERFFKRLLICSPGPTISGVRSCGKL